MNEELIIKLCETMEALKAFCALVSGGLLMCFSFVAGGAVYDLVTRHDEHKKIKEARSWRGRGKYPPLIDGKPWLQNNEEDEKDGE